VALNSVANYKILKETPFDEIYIQPAAGDSGAALGAALYVWHCMLKKPRRFILSSAYWGKGYTSDEIKVFLENSGIRYREFRNEDELLDYVVDSIIDQKIIGWYQGRCEWGPRALGNRKETNPLYHKLIERFYKKTDVPALINTSFNLRGEPIVNSPSDAYNTFVKSGMDNLVLGRFLIEKQSMQGI